MDTKTVTYEIIKRPGDLGHGAAYDAMIAHTEYVATTADGNEHWLFTIYSWAERAFEQALDTDDGIVQYDGV